MNNKNILFLLLISVLNCSYCQNQVSLIGIDVIYSYDTLKTNITLRYKVVNSSSLINIWMGLGFNSIDKMVGINVLHKIDLKIILILNKF